MKNLSITARITAWYTVFLLMVAVGLLLVMFTVEKANLAKIVKSTLLFVIEDACEDVKIEKGEVVIDSRLKFYEDGVYVSVLDGNEELIEGKMPRELAELPEFKDSTFRKMKDEKGKIWYIYDKHVTSNVQTGKAGEDVWIRGIAKNPTEESTGTMVMRYMLIAVPLLILIAAMGGFAITKRAFSPVRKIIGTADKIRKDGDLSRRIEIDGNSGRKDEISQLARSFNRAFDTVERTLEAEKHFTSDVSHELRTPLSVIISQSEYALSDEEYREEALQVISEEASRMSRLINRLLLLARSEAGRLERDFEEINLSELCESIVSQQEEIASEKGVRLIGNIEGNIFIKGDDGLIIRIILNLIDNAFKYGVKDGGSILVDLKKRDGWAVCTVADSGWGIASEDIDKIWNRFYGKGKDGYSAGLGLAMVKALTQLHGGEVSVVSGADADQTRFNEAYGEGAFSGAIFTVKLPLLGR